MNKLQLKKKLKKLKAKNAKLKELRKLDQKALAELAGKKG